MYIPSVNTSINDFSSFSGGGSGGQKLVIQGDLQGLAGAMGRGRWIKHRENWSGAVYRWILLSRA